jgi:hypothetical protein
MSASSAHITRRPHRRAVPNRARHRPTAWCLDVCDTKFAVVAVEGVVVPEREVPVDLERRVAVREIVPIPAGAIDV